MEQMTKEQAVKFAESGAWKDLSYEQRAKLQMGQELLCMPFDVFHESISKALGREVYTHELGLNAAGLRQELFLNAKPPTFKEIIELIPEKKRIILTA